MSAPLASPTHCFPAFSAYFANHTRATFQATTIEAELAGSPAGVSDHQQSAALVSANAALEDAVVVCGNPPTAVTFVEAFLENTEAFFDAMHAASCGRFLCDPVSVATVTAVSVECSVAGDHAPGVREVDHSGKVGMSKTSDGGLAERRERTPSSLSGGISLANLGATGRTGGVDAASLVSAALAKGALGSRSGACDVEDRRGSTDGEDWVQCSWLVGMGGFSLATFLANR